MRTIRADAIPTTDPTAIPDSISQYVSISLIRNVNATAIVIPAPAIQLPDLGRPWMRQALDADDQADRGHEVRQLDPGSTHRLVVLVGLPLLEHLQHPVGDEEADDDVDRPEHDRDEAERLSNDESAVPTISIADQDDSVDRVRPRHQRVCSIVGTFEISSKPRKTARAKIVSSATSWASRADGLAGDAGAGGYLVLPVQVSSPSGARWVSSACTFRA